MQINVTFIIQIINFWITYLVLHKILFKPVVQLLQNKETAKESLVEGIKTKEAGLLHLQEEKKKNLEDFRQYLKTKYAFQPQRQEEIPVLTIQETKREAIAKMVTQECDLIVQKAPHAY
jgi:F0F1-type ATP synthase membrane subunit b/b'